MKANRVHYSFIVCSCRADVKCVCLTLWSKFWTCVKMEIGFGILTKAACSPCSLSSNYEDAQKLLYTHTHTDYEDARKLLHTHTHIQSVNRQDFTKLTISLC